MSLAYGIIALVSLCMVGVCVLLDKKRDVWLLFVFVSVSLCNLGYFMTSISKTLGDALNSNRIAYLGSVFLPYFLLMMVLLLVLLVRPLGKARPPMKFSRSIIKTVIFTKEAASP